MSEEQSKQSARNANDPQNATQAFDRVVSGDTASASGATEAMPVQHQYAGPSGIPEAAGGSQDGVEGATGLPKQAGGYSVPGPNARAASAQSGRSASSPAVGSAAGSATKKRSVGLRRVKMTVARVDVLSALKLGFLISVVFAFMVVIAMAIIWFVLDSIHVFSQLQGLLETLNSPSLLEFMQYLEFGRWMSFAVIIAILDIVLLTALSAVAALVYNLICSLVGGLRISVTDE